MPDNAGVRCKGVVKAISGGGGPSLRPLRSPGPEFRPVCNNSKQQLEQSVINLRYRHKLGGRNYYRQFKLLIRDPNIDVSNLNKQTLRMNKPKDINDDMKR